MTLLFSESCCDWQPVPGWAEFLIRFGFNWPSANLRQRRIALVSMPCDSAAAGLIALGVLIRDLGNSNATNVGGHYDALLRYAQQYLQNCRSCDMHCHPELKRCGYTQEATGLIRDKNKKLYQISASTDFDQRHLVLSIEGGRWTVLSPKRALDLRIDGDPPTRLSGSSGALKENVYATMVDQAKIIASNLAESYSGLCLAGRAAGERATYKSYVKIRFRCSEIEHDLPDLLTINDWSSEATVSRMTFFNSRTERVNSPTTAPAVVVADGDASFLKILGQPEFQNSDVIGAIHRTVDRDRLELIGNRIIGLRQWYVDDLETLSGMPEAPKGMNALVLNRRVG